VKVNRHLAVVVFALAVLAAAPAWSARAVFTF